MTVTTIKRGEVYYIENSSQEKKAGEQSGTRPAVIISNDIGNRYSPTVIVAFLTSKPKKHLPTHVLIDTAKVTGRDSTVLCEQLLTVSKERVMTRVCSLSEGDMARVNEAVYISLGMGGENR